MRNNIKKIAALLLILTIAFSLAGCGEIQKAETTINQTFKALKELDFETASNYINVDEMMESDNSTDIDSDVFAQNLFGKLEYKIISSEKIDNNTVTVKTEITAVDMKPVLTEYFQKALQYAFANAFADPQPSEEETNKKMEEIFIECISKEDLVMVKTEVDIKVIKTDKKWKIESSDELSNALLGGLVKAAEELSNSFNDIE